MSAKSIVMAAAGSTAAPPYADDVFSTFLYGGNGGTLAIDNGINLSGSGGMVWMKNRSAVATGAIIDSSRGAGLFLYPALTNAQSTDQGTTFTGVGVSYGTGGTQYNQSANSYVAWTFRKAPKFFDVVTYTGDGATNRSISHSLGIQPGFMIIKRTDAAGGWIAVARTDATNSTLWDATAFTTSANGGSASSSTFYDQSVFKVGSAWSSASNTNGATYVAYLFAHDNSTTGLIQCGSFTADGSGNASVTSLGLEPQFLMVKASSTTGDWIMLDSLRGWNLTTADALLRANLTDAETASTEYGNPTTTGFDFKGGSASATYVYMAIRRPNKPPTVGTSVFNLATTAANGSAIASASIIPNFNRSAVRQVDLAIYANRAGSSLNFQFADKVRGFTNYATAPAQDASATPTLSTSGTAAENVTTGAIHVLKPSDGFENAVRFFTTGASNLGYAFKRAPGFFDVVGYAGNGGSPQSISHSLGVAPELAIVKNRTVGSFDGWYVGGWSGQSYMQLHTNAGAVGGAVFSASAGTEMTATSFNAYQPNINKSGTTYIAYLFATLAGISKVGTFTGNGGTQTINCGFTTGARFILIKRTDATGNWFVWDTARGVVAGNDPYLALNTTAAEVTTDDSIDTDTSGFIVNQVAATNINVNAATYLYLAIA